jgi:hypothetical protein
VGLLAPVRSYIDGLVHSSAQQDALTCSRHRAFVAPRLLRREHLRTRLPGAAEQPSNTLVKKSA